ncbi:ferredoxin [Planktotalea sp.]|uniref:ferredoxin n=1 Tax=Planktotalea sp. TaxID=2029877 RepID=UPI003D6ABE5F
MLDQIRLAAHAAHLEIFGVLHEGEGTIVLLGPHEPGFWATVKGAPEFLDEAADPLDRWSKRVITAIASKFELECSFPSDGPPYPAFISWALASKRAWVSPVGMLVHENAGLFVSYRGALHLPFRADLPPPTPLTPCQTCSAPCQSACPVNALSETHYDVAACKEHIRGKDSQSCQTLGCAARRACPVSLGYNRAPEQSAFHMRAFLRD